MSNDYVLDEATVRIGASVGIAAFPLHTSDAEELSRHADLALYAAKAAGKGRVTRFAPEMDVDAQTHLFIERELKEALEREELYLVYQPLLSTSEHRVEGFEALLRWEHRERGQISPGEFIPHAEKLGLMPTIGAYVLDKACGFASSWAVPDGGSPPFVAVNVSPSQMESGEFVSTVLECLARHDLPAERLELEITEEVLVADFERVVRTINQLKDAGVSVAVDDFGSGQTSLRYLSQFPISKLKIDRSFVSTLGDNRRSAEITQAMIALGRRLGVKVLAEGVEELGQLSSLESWHCDQVQGYLFSKPIAADAVLRLLANQHPLSPYTSTHDQPRKAANG